MLPSGLDLFLRLSDFRPCGLDGRGVFVNGVDFSLALNHSEP